MSIDVTDLLREHTGFLRGLVHCGKRGVAFRMRLGQVMRIGGGAVPSDFAQNLCSAKLRMLQCFQCEHGGPFAQRQPIPLRIEWPALRGRKRLERVKSGKDQLA